MGGFFEASALPDLKRLPELFCYPVACSPQAWSAGVVFPLLQSSMGLSIDATRNHRVNASRSAGFPGACQSPQHRGWRGFRGSHAFPVRQHGGCNGAAQKRRCGSPGGELTPSKLWVSSSVQRMIVFEGERNSYGIDS
jgi:hypothetical protein